MDNCRIQLEIFFRTFYKASEEGDFRAIKQIMNKLPWVIYSGTYQPKRVPVLKFCFFVRFKFKIGRVEVEGLSFAEPETLILIRRLCKEEKNEREGLMRF